jgi:putative Mn2+ efflux pump MntP
MQSVDNFLLAMGLNVDSAALGMSLALVAQRSDKSFAFKWSLYFGGFQGLMFFLGYFGFSLVSFLHLYSHFMAGSVFLVLGLKLLVPAYYGKEESVSVPGSFLSTVFFSASISVDAFFSSVAGLKHDMVSVLSLAILIALVGFMLTFISIHFAGRIRPSERRASMVAGGFLLIFLGVKSFL